MSRHSRRVRIVLSSFAFISLGLPDGLLGVAWPSVRLTFGRDLDALGVLLLAATVGYIGSSFASGRLLQRVNLGAVLALSCALTAAALSGFALAREWWWLPPLAALLGLGGGAIDAALNTYVASNHGSRALNWLHACYGIGAATGPLIMTAVLRADAPWQRGYAIVGAAQLSLAAAFAATVHQWPTTTGGAETHETVRLSETLRLPAARLGVILFVAYTGVEATFGAWTYTLLTIGRGVDPAVAGGMVSVFWGGLTAGRLIAAGVGGRFTPSGILHGSLIAILAGALGVWLHAETAMTLASIALAGLACGPIFPTLVALTPARVGAAHVGNAVGFQIAAGAVGLSVVPALVGLLATAGGIEMIASALLVLTAGLAIVYRLWQRS